MPTHTIKEYQEALNSIKDISFQYKDTDMRIRLFNRDDGRIALLQELIDNLKEKDESIPFP